MLACFRGTISAKLNTLQQQLQRTDIISQPDNKHQVQKLNNLESQAWLYQSILDRLGVDPAANHEKIARTIEALEYKRSEILQELEPRRPRRYQILAELQDSVRSFLASQAEKDYEKLQKIVTNLVLFTRTRPPSQIVLSEVIERLAQEIASNASQISPYRLRLAFMIDELMKVLSDKLILITNKEFNSDNNYQSIVNELRSRLNLLSQEFGKLLAAKQEDKNEIDRHIEEIYSLSQNISHLHREISRRDADIVTLQKHIENLTKNVQNKQEQISSLQNSISELRVNSKNVTDVEREKQNYINNLQAKKSELEQKYRTLYQYCEQQQNEILNLKTQLSQLHKPQSYTSSYPSYKQPNPQPISTEKKISVDEYNRIYNKSDYVYVKAHWRNGTYVQAYYRRRPRR